MKRHTAARRCPTRLVWPQRRQLRQNGYGHFRILRPWDTHWREAECNEVDCPHYLQGWMTVVPTKSPQAEYIRHECGRHFTEEKREGGLSAFTFPSGQRCFRDHKLPKDMQEHYLHDKRLHERPIDWVEDFNEETDKIKRQRERG